MDLRADSLTVAPALLGWTLTSQQGGEVVGGRIVEVEAYHGETDPASHAARGRTPRTAPMYAEGGVIYVYLSYGLHTCLNLVTGPAGEAQAVLVRALEPTIGLEAMTARRHLDGRPRLDSRLLTSGPGRVGQALGLTIADSGSRLGDVVSLTPPDTPLSPQLIHSGPRIGITRAADRPWRFWIAGNPFVTPPRV